MKLRRTMLYVPGNNAAMVKDAHIYRSDAIMFDLEDAIAVQEKDSARFLVYHALRNLNYEGMETVVRINGLDTPYGRDDIAAIVNARPNLIRIPKADNAAATGNPKAAQKPATRPVPTPARAPAPAVVKGETSESPAGAVRESEKPSHSRYAKEPTRQARL